MKDGRLLWQNEIERCFDALQMKLSWDRDGWNESPRPPTLIIIISQRPLPQFHCPLIACRAMGLFSGLTKTTNLWGNESKYNRLACKPLKPTRAVPGQRNVAQWAQIKRSCRLIEHKQNGGRWIKVKWSSGSTNDTAEGLNEAFYNSCLYSNHSCPGLCCSCTFHWIFFSSDAEGRASKVSDWWRLKPVGGLRENMLMFCCTLIKFWVFAIMVL